MGVLRLIEGAGLSEQCDESAAMRGSFVMGLTAFFTSDVARRWEFVLRDINWYAATPDGERQVTGSGVFWRDWSASSQGEAYLQRAWLWLSFDGGEVQPYFGFNMDAWASGESDPISNLMVAPLDGKPCDGVSLLLESQYAFPDSLVFRVDSLQSSVAQALVCAGETLQPRSLSGNIQLVPIGGAGPIAEYAIAKWDVSVAGGEWIQLDGFGRLTVRGKRQRVELALRPDCTLDPLFFPEESQIGDPSLSEISFSLQHTDSSCQVTQITVLAERL